MESSQISSHSAIEGGHDQMIYCQNRLGYLNANAAREKMINSVHLAMSGKYKSRRGYVENLMDIPSCFQMKDLLTCSSEGCSWCIVIYGSIQNYLNLYEPDWAQDTELNIEPAESATSTTGLSLHVHKFDPDLVVSIPLDIFTVEGDPKLPFDEIDVILPTIVEPNSEALVSFVKTRIASCSKNHGRCGNVEDRALPKRVVDVGTGARAPFLYEPRNGETGRYVSLSYRWGSPSQHLTTTRENLDAFRSALPSHRLPRTIREAIDFTRVVGCQYLWVDALCIVQDDVNEWKEESLKMGEVYAESLFTLAAVASEHSQDGLIPGSYPEYEQITAIELELDDGKIATVYTGFENLKYSPMAWHNYDYFSYKGPDFPPLFERAWTYQELILSTRMLMLSLRGPIWVCRSSIHLATQRGPLFSHLPAKDIFHHLLGGPEISEKATYLDAHFNHWRTGLMKFTLIPHMKSTRPVEQLVDIDFAWHPQSTFASSWMELIQDYTQKKASHREDRLRAIASIAKRFQKRVNVDYLAGLWYDSGCLHILLNWRHHQHDIKPKDLCGNPLRCVQDWSPPTWSWAATDGPIKWPHPSDYVGEPHCQILSVTGLNLFDHGDGASITIKAHELPLKQSKLYWSTAGEFGYDERVLYYQICLKCELIDADLELEACEEMWEIVIGTENDCALHRFQWLRTVDERVGQEISLILLADRNDIGGITPQFLIVTPEQYNAAARLRVDTSFQLNRLLCPEEASSVVARRGCAILGELGKRAQELEAQEIILL